MKKIIFSIFTLFFLVLNLQAGNNSFEGSMTWSISEKKTDGNTASSIGLLIKNNKVAVNAGATDKAPKMVLDLNTGFFYSVIEQGSQKMVMKLDVKVLKGIGGLGTMLGSGYSSVLNSKDNDTKIQLTSDTKTISGYKCKKYTFKNEDSQGEIWATEEVPFNLSSLFDIMNLSSNVENSGLSKSLPMSGAATNLKTKEVSSFTVNIEPKTLSDNLFTIPDGYPVMDMTSMFQQMLETNDPAQIQQVFKKIAQK